MKVVTKTFTRAGTVNIALNGEELFGLDPETVIKVTASGSGIAVAVWPTGTISIRNTSNADRTIDIVVDEVAPLVPEGMTLQAGFYAIVSTKELRVYNDYGELQTGYTSQNAA